MRTTYHEEVWARAVRDAEADVMRATATPSGGRLPNEDLMAYVERTKQIQGAALARWLTAKAELDMARAECTPQPPAPPTINP